MALTALQVEASVILTEKGPLGPGACSDTPLRLTFSGPVHLGSEGKIVVSGASDHVIADTLDLAPGIFTDTYGGKTLRIDPIVCDGSSAVVHLHAHVLHPGVSYLITIDPKVFLGADNQPFPGVAETDGWTFTVKAASASQPAQRVVAADGTGDFCTLQGALDDIPLPNSQPAMILIKPGTYDGLIRVVPTLNHVSLVGEDRKKTVLTGLNNDKLNPGAAARCLIAVEGNDFVMKNLTVRNRTPYLGSQAESLYLKADRCVLRDDDFYSYQDTLCLNGRVFMSNCYVEGDVDFIWGYGAVFVDQCVIHAAHNGYFVQARNPVGKPGYIFSRCQLTCANTVKKCWLARIAPATFPASQVAYLNCSMGPGIPPEGWKLDAAKGTDAKQIVAGPQLQFEEYQSLDLQGKPIDVSHRLAGSRQLADTDAVALSDPAKLLAGPDQWNPAKDGLDP